MNQHVLREMVARIHRIPELTDCTVGFQGDGSSRLVSEPKQSHATVSKVVVVIEEIRSPEPALKAEMERNSRMGVVQGGPGAAPLLTNRSKLLPELLGAGWNCGIMIYSGFGIVAGIGAAPVSGGTSLFLTVTAAVGFASSAIQCANGVFRVTSILSEPESTSLADLDSNEAYRNAMTLVDASGVIAGGAAMTAFVRRLWTHVPLQRAFGARNITADSLRTMNGVQRKQVLTEIFRDASRTPDGRKAMLTVVAGESNVPARVLQHAHVSVKNARHIHEHVIRRVSDSLKEVILNGVGIGMSATPDRWTGSASGSVNWLINVLWPEPAATN